jgi:hypothetical protein
MLFGLAKLTLKKVRAKIIAPSQDSHLNQFSINGAGEFCFKHIESPFKFNNITVILGEETKRRLQEAADEKRTYARIRDSLLASLTTNSAPVSFDIPDCIPKQYLRGYDFPYVLLEAICDRFSPPRAEKLSVVRQLIEGHYTDANIPSAYGYLPIGWRRASPLSAAICIQSPEIVSYLLMAGADLFYTFRGQTVYEFALRECSCIMLSQSGAIKRY